MDLLGWVIFVVALLFSVMLHETGHFILAKRFGMKVTRYFVGFGPTIWSTWRGETEYGIKALPLGGFVKIVGMHSLDDPDDPADEALSFRSKPAWQRIAVLCAGSFMHFLLAFLLIGALALGVGIANDNVTQRTDSLGGTLTYVYDNANRLTSEQFTGTGATGTTVRVDFGYSNRDQQTTITWYSNLAGTATVALPLRGVRVPSIPFCANASPGNNSATAKNPFPAARNPRHALPATRPARSRSTARRWGARGRRAGACRSA